MPDVVAARRAVSPLHLLTRGGSMTSEVEGLIEGYLRDLEAGLEGLAPKRRRQVLDEVGQRIARARADLDGETEAAVRAVLRRIGEPADVAAEAVRRFSVQAAGPSSRRFEIIALVLLMIPFAGWATGVVLVWMSRVWSTRDKVIATLAGMSWVLAGLATLLVSAAGSAPVGSTPVQTADPSPLAVIVFVAPFVLPIVAAIYLALRLRAAGTASLDAAEG
jgi:uncharacterized membrane protein